MSTLLNPQTRSNAARATLGDDLLDGLRVEVNPGAGLHLDARPAMPAEDEVMESSDLAEVLDAFECGGGVDLAVEVVNAPAPRTEPAPLDEREAYRVTWWKKTWASSAFYTIGQPPRARGL